MPSSTSRANIEGLSANYSGDGFSHMRFKFHGLSQAGFDQWVAQGEVERHLLNRPTPI